MIGRTNAGIGNIHTPGEAGFYFVRNGALTENTLYNSNGAGNVVEHPFYVEFTSLATNKAFAFTSTNKVDLTPYNVMVIDIMDGYSYTSSGKVPILCIGTDRPEVNPDSGTSVSNVVAYMQITQSSNDISTQRITWGLSSVTGEYYVGFILCGRSGVRGRMNIINFRLAE